jgi:hypothetical protein
VKNTFERVVRNIQERIFIFFKFMLIFSRIENNFVSPHSQSYSIIKEDLKVESKTSRTRSSSFNMQEENFKQSYIALNA